MHRDPLDSSFLASAGYLPEERLLDVELRSQEVYRYFDVPQHTYGELLAAESKGSYFNGYIRNGFRYQKLHPQSAVGAPV
jgi:KTSC domain-containing protein